MDTGLQGKAALAGGASKGIGRAIALGLAREGCAVAICARNFGPLEEAAAAVRRGGSRRQRPPDRLRACSSSR